MNNCKISDFISRLNTANKLNKTKIIIPYSKDIFHILQILNKETTNILKFKKFNEFEIEILLLNKFHKITILSTYGRRRYISVKHIKTLDRGLGFYILRTSQGFMSCMSAIENNIGGELILNFK